MNKLQNGEKSTGQQPRDELDMQAKILQQSESNPLLQDTNLGVGNYDEDYLWQQIRSYRKGLYAWIAFGRILTERAIYETQVKLGREGFQHLDEQSEEIVTWEPVDSEGVADDKSSWTAERERGRDIWAEIGDPREPFSAKQAAAVVEKSGADLDWKPVFWEMVSGRHEASRSRDAELLRDFLTSIKQVRGDLDSDDAAKLLGGGRRG